MTVPLAVVGLSALIAFEGSPAGDGRYSMVAAWVDSLPFDNRVIDEIELYADEERSEFDEGYALRLAAGIRRLIGADAERQLVRLSEGIRRAFIEVSILDPGFASVGGKPPDNKTERDFEKSFIRTEVLAFFKNEATSPETALDLYTDKEFRKTVSSRIERIWIEGEEVCVAMGGVKLLLDPIECCDRIAELQREDISLQHAQTVRNAGNGGHQAVFFKESIKTFVRLPDGLAFHYINYSRTVSMGGIQGMVARGKIEDSEKRAVEELGRRLASRSSEAAHAGEPGRLPILQNWSGDYPVAEFDRLPDGQRESRVGCIGDAMVLAAVWQAFRPGEKPPELGFDDNLVVFSRNVDYYNRTSIERVLLKDGVADVVAIETRSAIPIEDRVAIAFAAIPRAGVRFVQAGENRIPVPERNAAGRPLEPGTDPRNATYRIESKEIPLVNGRFETRPAPGSAMKEQIWVFREPEFGDLDEDGSQDAAVVLVHDPGGSGMFYYVAAALQRNGKYRGTNAVLLGDRVAPQTVQIRNGVIVANYADRRPEESMTTPPSSAKSMYLTVEGTELAAMKPLGEGEQLLEGWVTIGHEVRTFLPCSKQKALWLLGDSPALSEILRAYRKAPHAPEPYAAFFMTLAGKMAAAPGDGFGAEYEEGFYATRLVKSWVRGSCKSD
jgi:hypothetical protein